MSSTKNTEKKDKWWWTGYLIFAAAVIGAWFFSKIQFNTQNYAKGFDGDSSGSIFIEEETENPLFTETEILQLCDEVKKTSEKLSMNILIYAGHVSKSDYEVEEFADQCYDYIFGEDTDGLFYYIDMTGKTPAYDYISTSGKAVIYYQKNIDDIFYSLDEFLPSSEKVLEYGYAGFKPELKSAVRKFLHELEYYADNFDRNYFYKSPRTGRNVFYSGETLYVTEARSPVQKFCLIVAGLIIGFIVSRIFKASVKRKYRFISPVSSDIYLAEDGVNIRCGDVFVHEYTTERYHPPASSSGGGGSHGHSGGGSHGGGGHHR